MFKEDIQRSIGSVLKANGHKMVNLGRGRIFYIKRFSDKLAFYVQCVNEEWNEQVTIEWFFTAIDWPESISHLGIGLHIPLLTMILGDKEPLEDFPAVYATPETADSVLIDIGKKIVALENSMGPVTEQMILTDLNNPYLPTGRDIVYKEEIQGYDILNEDEEFKEAFSELKINCYKTKKKYSAIYELVSQFIDNLPENYFENKGVCFETNINCKSIDCLKGDISRHLDAQCLFGLKINGKVFGSQKDEDTHQKLTKAKQQEIKEAIKATLDDFGIKTKADFMSNEGDSGLYEDLKAGVMEEYGIEDEVMGKLLDAVIRKLPKK